MSDQPSDTTHPDAGASEPSSAESDGTDGPGPELDRLPPPAFPPGSRRSSMGSGRTTVEPGTGDDDDRSDIPDDAFISPDDPIRKEGRGIPDDAFISPDDPLVTTSRDEEGEVTGLGVKAPDYPPSGGRSRRDRPTIHELPYLLDQLAERIQASGSRALNVNPEMGHFQAALRSFLKGYLEGSGD